jgi:hypothetical protein
MQAVRDESAKYVRFYFGVSISHLIPPNPYGKGGRGRPFRRPWAERCMERLRADIEAKISREGFEVGYRKHVAVNAALRLYAADFVVSTLHRFPAAQIFFPRKKQSDFKVKTKRFSKIKTILQKKIVDLLKIDYVVNSIAYEYAASRDFIYEVYLEGTLIIKHVLSPSDIREAEGSVRMAIENFNSEVVDLLQTYGWEATPETTSRPPKDHAYEFGLYQTRHLAFSENEVFGNMILMTKGMATNRASLLSIDCDDDRLVEAISAVEDELKCFIDSESSYSVAQLTVGFADYDEELHDYVNELTI